MNFADRIAELVRLTAELEFDLAAGDVLRSVQARRQGNGRTYGSRQDTAKARARRVAWLKESLPRPLGGSLDADALEAIRAALSEAGMVQNDDTRLRGEIIEALK